MIFFPPVALRIERRHISRVESQRRLADGSAEGRPTVLSWQISSGRGEYCRRWHYGLRSAACQSPDGIDKNELPFWGCSVPRLFAGLVLMAAQGRMRQGRGECDGAENHRWPPWLKPVTMGETLQPPAQTSEGAADRPR
jgi:hypothetical protein